MRSSIATANTALSAQLPRFFIVGLIAFVIDFGVMTVLIEGFGVEKVISTSVAFTVSCVVNYFLSMKFVFKAQDGMDDRLRFVVFFAMSLIGLALTDIMMFVGSSIIGIHYMAVKIFATAVVTAYNFITRKLIFEKKNSRGSKNPRLLAAVSKNAVIGHRLINGDAACRQPDEHR